MCSQAELAAEAEAAVCVSSVYLRLLVAACVLLCVNKSNGQMGKWVNGRMGKWAKGCAVCCFSLPHLELAKCLCQAVKSRARLKLLKLARKKAEKELAKSFANQLKL